MIWFLIIVVAIATYFDLKSRRIPNWLTYPSFVIALFYFDKFFIIATLVALIAAILFGKYIGAGDIKLALVISFWSHILSWSQYWLYFALFLGGIAGLFQRNKRIPFAPYMAAGIVIANVARGMAII